MRSTITAAKRPLLLIGRGVHLSQAYDALERFAEAQAEQLGRTSGRNSNRVAGRTWRHAIANLVPGHSEVMTARTAWKARQR